MHLDDKLGISRRELGKRTAIVGAATALAGIAVPHVYGAVGSTIQVALVGCGGRGTGAAGDALRVKANPMKLVAMADVFKDRLESSYHNLSGDGGIASKVDVPPDRRFIGFDAYKKAIDVLKPGDVVIFATPLAFRWVHFTYAIEKGVNVFMEKPLSSDGYASKKLLALAEEASKKNLKVGVGLMSRHQRALQELQKRIADGEIGDVVLMRGYRMAGPVGTFSSTPKPANMSELEFQIRRFHSFIWAGGGCFSDFNIHIIDHLCWMKNAWPVSAQGVGGRHYKTAPNGQPFVDQNFDSYGIEYTFGDGTKLLFDGRCINGAEVKYNSFVHGTKGCAVASSNGDCGTPSATFKGLAADDGNKIWQSTNNSHPYQNEWDDLVEAIIKDKPYNEVPRGVQASLVTSMGRMAAHIGKEVKYDEMLNSEDVYARDVDKLDYNAPAPVKADDKGMYPQPEPGIKNKEY